MSKLRKVFGSWGTEPSIVYEMYCGVDNSGPSDDPNYPYTSGKPFWDEFTRFHQPHRDLLESLRVSHNKELAASLVRDIRAEKSRTGNPLEVLVCMPTTGQDDFRKEIVPLLLECGMVEGRDYNIRLCPALSSFGYMRARDSAWIPHVGALLSPGTPQDLQKAKDALAGLILENDLKLTFFHFFRFFKHSIVLQQFCSSQC